MAPLLVFCHFCEIHGPSCVFRTDCVPLDIKIESSENRSLCEGCSFDAKGLEGYVWTDPEASVKYVSSPCSKQFPDNNTVRQSCIRSLSCEVYPEGREGVVYFGDDRRAHVISYCFVLKDSQARGFQRTYSFLVIDSNQNALLSSWSHYVTQIGQLIGKLKAKANSVYEKEVSLSHNPGQERRSIRLESALQVAGRGRNAMNTQRSESRARSLVELTDDTTIFAFLHLNMAMILRNAKSTALNDAMVYDADVGSKLRELYCQSTGLGRNDFLQCAYNLLIGNQIVIRCDSVALARKILLSLSQLLPPQAVRISFDCDTYFSPQLCNFLHVKNNVPLPSQMNQEKVLFLESIGPSDEKVVLRSDQTLIPEKLPSFLLSLDQVLSDTHYSDSCLTFYVESLKHQWVEKSKLFSALESAPNSMTLKVLGVSEADLALVAFWQSCIQAD